MMGPKQRAQNSPNSKRFRVPKERFAEAERKLDQLKQAFERRSRNGIMDGMEERLSALEYQVLLLSPAVLPDDEIASQMKLNSSAVRGLKKSICDNFGVNGRAASALLIRILSKRVARSPH